MDSYLIDDIEFNPDIGEVLKSLRLKEDSSDALTIRRMVSEARETARPKGLFTVCFIQKHEADHVEIEGIEFHSRVLRVNLENVHRVFPNVATCGVELDRWAEGYSDILENFWADTIKELALREAVEAVDARLSTLNASGRFSSMSPGSLEDWPITEQLHLFKLLGEKVSETGVSLTDSCLMIPTKSLSRLSFPAEHRFESCRLCPRERCPGRRAPYDPDLFARKYKPAGL